MHQPDSAAGGGARKMAHPAMLPRAGGGGGGGSSLDDSPPAAAAAPLPPPQSLSLAGPAGAQLKKKSGFQITSVTPAAQISASLSSNNSIAEDTESYDDLDESHTEDLSSSEILDVSLSRATDPLGGPERSSSEETLSNFHEADTPGAVSPNQPRLPPPPPPPHHLNGAAHPAPPASANANARPPPAPAPLSAASSSAAAAARAPPLRAPAAAAGRSPLPGKGAGHGALSAGLGNGPAGLAPGPNPAPPGQAQPSAGAAPAAASRFRVVKLDSSSEPFKKGRWTCTEFYDKEGLGAAAAVAEGGPPSKGGDLPRPPNPPEGPERDSPSGSSVSGSSASTLSHYTESVGSGEMVAVEGGSLPQSLSQPQLHQEATYPPQKPPPPSAGLPPQGAPQQPAMPAVLPPPPQQLPYAQPVPVTPQPPLSYGVGQAQQLPVQMAPGHVKAAIPSPLPGADYIQHPTRLQAPLTSMQPGPGVVGTGTPTPAAPVPSVQPSGPAQLAMAPSQPAACVQAPMPVPMMNASQQGAMPPVVQQPLVASQMAPSVMPQSAAPSQGVPSVPPGMIPPGSQAGTSGHSQPLVMAPQTTLLPAQAQVQSGEPLVPGMAGPQVPAVSPGPAVSGHCAASMPSPPVSLAPSKNVALSSAVQNENLVQKLPQSLLTSANISLAMPRNVPPLNSAQFSAQSLAQSSAGRSEEARRSTDPLLMGIAQPLGQESGTGVPSALSDGSGSMAASLFPLKGLPLTAQLMDGEDDGSSGASVVAIDNKIEQAMDLVKSHLMYAVREEVEVLKEQIKELIEKNNQLEQENTLLKTLASPEQLAQFQAQLQTTSSPASSQPQGTGQQPALPGSGPSA